MRNGTQKRGKIMKINPTVLVVAITDWAGDQISPYRRGWDGSLLQDDITRRFYGVREVIGYTGWFDWDTGYPTTDAQMAAGRGALSRQLS
jgi:hypothetical protein